MTARGDLTERVRLSTRAQALVSGELSPEDLDDEELMRGQVREASGRFAHKPPSLIPRQLRDELQRRLLARGDEILKRGYLVATQLMVEVVQDQNVPVKERLSAAKFIIDKIAPDKIEVVHRSETPIEQMLREAMSEGGLVVGSSASIVEEENTHGRLPAGPTQQP